VHLSSWLKQQQRQRQKRELKNGEPKRELEKTKTKKTPAEWGSLGAERPLGWGWRKKETAALKTVLNGKVLTDLTLDGGFIAL